MKEILRFITFGRLSVKQSIETDLIAPAYIITNDLILGLTSIAPIQQLQLASNDINYSGFKSVTAGIIIIKHHGGINDR